jgi:hypothetical protein
MGKDIAEDFGQTSMTGGDPYRAEFVQLVKLTGAVSRSADDARP